MVNTSQKIEEVVRLIQKGKYFTINRPRQYGKTTTLYLLEKALENDYLLISTSFEGLGDEEFQNPQNLSTVFVNHIFKALKMDKREDILQKIEKPKDLNSLEDLSTFITNMVSNVEKKIVLMVDEVDRASNHRLFLNFLGMLRNKYLKRDTGKDFTFHSVILAGVHDIKNIKLKLRPEENKDGLQPVSTYNSPWNIATEFDVDMSFHPDEIATMLVDYEKDMQTGMDISLVSKEIYKFTNGYPFLVSKTCKVIDEKLKRNWSLEGIQGAVNIILQEQNTLFDDLIKNVENNTDLSGILQAISIENQEISYNVDNPILNKGIMYGIITKVKPNQVGISNKIFEIRLYDYYVSKLETSNLSLGAYSFHSLFLDKNGDLEMEKVLLKFQQFVKETYSDKDQDFYERQGRLLLIAFTKPIATGCS